MGTSGNLMFLLEDHLHQVEEMKDEIEAKKKLTPRRLPSQKKNSVRESFINSFFTRATQRTVRFIRCASWIITKSSPYQTSLIELAKV